MSIRFLSLLITPAITIGIMAVVTKGAGSHRVIESEAIVLGSTMMLNTSALTATVGKVKCRIPIAGVVTLGTVWAKLAGMDSRFSMAGGAVCGWTLINTPV